MKKNLKTAEAAEFLRSKGINVSPVTLSLWRTRGKGPPYKKIGTYVFYEVGDLEEFEKGVKIVPQESKRIANVE